jgi:hypothetical protein
MADGFYLSLMIGPLVPLPAPKEVIDALTSVKVISASGDEQSGFELSFALSNRSPLHTLFLISGGSVLPLMRVIITVTVNGTPEVLMDGVVTRQEVTPGSNPGFSTLNIKGKDLTAVMNYLPMDGFPFPAMPPEARVLTILAKYAFLGILPAVIPSPMIDIPIPIDRIPRQQGKDLEYIKMLADDVGYVFYLEPGPLPGASIAYWGPEIKVGVPQPALNFDMDAHTNVDSLSFGYDGDSKMMPIVFIQEQATKMPIPIPIPDVNPLSPPLGLIPAMPKDFNFIDTAAKLSPVLAIMIGLAKAAKTADVVSAEGSLDVLRYGHVLKARRLVGVRGAGPAFDGVYFVKKVTHEIKRGSYKESFTLSRNGLISTVPKVPV